MTRDEEAAEQYCDMNYSQPTGEDGEIRKLEIVNAFKAGIEHERKRSQILVEALDYISYQHHKIDPYMDTKDYANEALEKYGTQNDEVSANNKNK